MVNRTVNFAAGLLWCYAGLLVVEALTVGAGRHWTDWGHFILHILGALAVSLLAVAVRRGRRQAWLIVVIVGGLMSLLGLASLLILFSLPAPAQREILQGFPQLFQLGSLSFPLFVLSVGVLASSVTLLLTRTARVFFQSHRE